ncbi:hypothetical protein R1sor_002878 [Riccia sorocarpa]|uniref:Transposase n=1 Tax=Riccia sorocarpa TaxID=122646 RepID=A0ABD3H251_9MARC
MDVERFCRRCQKSLSIEEFSKRQRRTNVTKVHRECNRCFSSRQTTRLYEPVPDTPDVDLIVKTCNYEQLSHMVSLAFHEAAILEVAVYQHWVVDCSEECMEALISWEGSENPCNRFKVWVEELIDKGLRPAFFITDKDAGQIEAAQRSIPEIHVQLRLKHCLDAIERRMVAVDMGINPYDPSATHNIFSFIDPTWGPSICDIVTGSICPPEQRPNVNILSPNTSICTR